MSLNAQTPQIAVGNSMGKIYVAKCRRLRCKGSRHYVYSWPLCSTFVFFYLDNEVEFRPFLLMLKLRQVSAPLLNHSLPLLRYNHRELPDRSQMQLQCAQQQVRPLIAMRQCPTVASYPLRKGAPHHHCYSPTVKTLSRSQEHLLMMSIPFHQCLSPTVKTKTGS